jgi:hypothetical protein
VELYLHTATCLHSVVLKQLGTGRSLCFAVCSTEHDCPTCLLVSKSHTYKLVGLLGWVVGSLGRPLPTKNHTHTGGNVDTIARRECNRP